MIEEKFTKLMENRGFQLSYVTKSSATFVNLNTGVYCTIYENGEFELHAMIHNLFTFSPGKAGPIDNDKLFERLNRVMTHYVRVCRENKFEF